MEWNAELRAIAGWIFFIFFARWAVGFGDGIGEFKYMRMD